MTSTQTTSSTSSEEDPLYYDSSIDQWIQFKVVAPTYTLYKLDWKEHSCIWIKFGETVHYRAKLSKERIKRMNIGIYKSTPLNHNFMTVLLFLILT